MTEIFTSEINLKNLFATYRREIIYGFETKIYKLSDDYEDWHNILQSPYSLFRDDIKIVGIRLYPIVELAHNEFVHFGNPFEKVGVFIQCKEFEKIQSQNPEWKLYNIYKNDCFETVNQFYEKVKTFDMPSTYYELEPENSIDFFKKYKIKNGQLLLYYLKKKYKI